jgi:trans-aconitate methyltransferase
MPTDPVPPLPPEVDTNRPSIARIYDHFLGGSANFESDREVGDRALASQPKLRQTVWANRAFLRRVVRYLTAECGISQFLDLGSGVPTVGNVHEIAHQVNPEARIVYVDRDPIAVAHSRYLLADDERVGVVQADLRAVDQVLAAPEVRDRLDLSQPLGLLMVAVLHFIPDSEDPAGIIAQYLARLAPGSYLAISHATLDPDQRSQAEVVDEYAQKVDVTVVIRTPEQLATWVAPLEIVAPGIVPVSMWRPDNEHVEEAVAHAVLARKPS